VAQDDGGQLMLSFIEANRKRGKEIAGYEYAVFVTNTRYGILTLGQLYRDRADAENAFDELKNQWGWGGYTTHDLHRCQLAARAVALIYNWWSLGSLLAARLLVTYGHPPVKLTTCPVANGERPDARNAINSPISCGSPRRPMGTLLAISRRPAGSSMNRARGFQNSGRRPGRQSRYRDKPAGVALGVVLEPLRDQHTGMHGSAARHP
jgi:hypothetical protein